MFPPSSWFFLMALAFPKYMGHISPFVLAPRAAGRRVQRGPQAVQVVGVRESARLQPPQVDCLGPVQPPVGLWIFHASSLVVVKNLSVRGRKLLDIAVGVPVAPSSVRRDLGCVGNSSAGVPHNNGGCPLGERVAAGKLPRDEMGTLVVVGRDAGVFSAVSIVVVVVAAVVFLVPSSPTCAGNHLRDLFIIVPDTKSPALALSMRATSADTQPLV